jgi:hypothetical protein
MLFFLVLSTLPGALYGNFSSVFGSFWRYSTRGDIFMFLFRASIIFKRNCYDTVSSHHNSPS